MSKRKKQRARRRARKPHPVAAGARLSACLIVKDEAEYLANCLASLRGLADEIIVVDTGSTDDTMDIARVHGARVFEQPWPGSFSAARNVSLEHATGDWILVVDADEVIAAADHAAVRAVLAASPEVMGYILVQRNYTSDQTTARWTRTEPDCAEACGVPGWFPARITRLFRRDPRIRFEGEVHEAVDGAIQALGGRIDETAIPIHHYGKLRDDERMQAKAALYRTLGEHKAARTGSAVAHYELGLQYAELGVLDKAETALREAVRIDATLVKGWADLGSVIERQGNAAEAEALYRRALELDPQYLPALVNLGAVLGKQGRRGEAMAAFAQARRLNPDNPVILNNLAAHYAQGNDLAAAEELYRRAVAINPRYLHARVNLGNLLERAGRYDAAVEELQATCAQFPRHAPAHAALALVHLRRQEWADAVAAAERAVALNGEDHVVWTNLGLALYQLGRIERALAATYRATELQPDYAPASRNWMQLAGQFPDVAARVMQPPQASIEVVTGPRIALFHQGVPFTGATLRERGLGGTESAVVYVAEALVRRGCRVTVFNRCDAPADVAGVQYRPAAGCGEAWAAAPPDVLVAARSWQGLAVAPPGVQRIFWAHDAADQPAVQGLADPEIRASIDRYLGISAWQIEGYCAAFGMPRDQWIQTRNGIDASRFATPRPDRDRGKLVYTSTPFRGLDVLLQVFPRIREAVPSATLDLYTSMAVYGVDAAADRAEFGALYAQADQPGVRLLGSVPQAELSHALLGAGLLAYPNHFAETSCIAALEAQAAGCPVVTSARGALPETVADGESGWCLPGDPHSAAYQDAFVEAVVTLLRDTDRWNAFSAAGRARVLEHYTWDRIAGEWLEQFVMVPA